MGSDVSDPDEEDFFVKIALTYGPPVYLSYARRYQLVFLGKSIIEDMIRKAEDYGNASSE